MTRPFMNPEIQARWVAALRSGEYEQGEGHLHTRRADPADPMDLHCCLGILCEIAVKDGVISRETSSRVVDSDEIIFGYGSGRGESGSFSISYLPTAVQEWAGLDTGNPIVFVPSPLVDDGDLTPIQLAELNDNRRPFTEIADIIEAQTEYTGD